VAIIPARGGSKRLPRKNVLEVAGRPMLAYPIFCALESELFDAVLVSTDDEEIAELARRAGASVIDRPAELAVDRSTVVQVCLHALEVIDGRLPGVFCCIYATAIFLTPKHLRASGKLLDAAPPADVVMGVSEYHIHPVLALKEGDGYLTRMWPEYSGVQSQFYPCLVASNGTLYWARTDAFRRERTFYANRLRGYLIPRHEAVDIDTSEDLELARRMMAWRGAP
jgi:N-acylneuraminate cytidylyltransferase